MGVTKYATDEERKAAVREQKKRWRKANPDYSRQWRAANIEKCRGAERRWREANPDYIRGWKKANPDYDRRWREANPDYSRRWLQANRQKHRATWQRYQARKRDQHGLVPVTAEVIDQRFELFGHACAYCGAQHDLHIDHFIPLAKGGTHAPSNLVPACPSCNSSKCDSDPEQWYRQQPSFNERRWKQIQKATGHHKAPGQLALI